MESIKSLNAAQLTVLSILNHGYSDADLTDLKSVLLDFNQKKLALHLDEIVNEKGFVLSDFEKITNSHHRKSK